MTGQRAWILAVGLLLLVGCRSTRATGDEPVPDPALAGAESEWCAVQVRNETRWLLSLRYASSAGTGVVGEASPGGTVSFSALCRLGAVRVLGYYLGRQGRQVRGATDMIRLDPSRATWGVLRPTRRYR